MQYDKRIHCKFVAVQDRVYWDSDNRKVADVRYICALSGRPCKMSDCTDYEPKGGTK